MNELRDLEESILGALWARGENQVPKRHAVLWLLLAGISLLAGCKKSSESAAPNFFGSPPAVSEVSITNQL
jgi:hypothetical protein